MSNACILLATAWPIWPMPIIPRVFPANSWPKKNSGAQPVKPLVRINWSPSTTRWAKLIINAQVTSAVDVVETFGVLVTGMPFDLA